GTASGCLPRRGHYSGRIEGAAPAGAEPPSGADRPARSAGAPPRRSAGGAVRVAGADGVLRANPDAAGRTDTDGEAAGLATARGADHRRGELLGDPPCDTFAVSAGESDGPGDVERVSGEVGC